MKPETFIILSPGFPANDADSTCLSSLQLFVKLLKKKLPSMQIIILAFQYPFVKGEYDWHDCSVIALGGKGRSKIFRLLLWRKAWKKLKQLTKENDTIGLLSLWCGECALVGSRFGKKYAIKHYCWIRGQDAKKENNYVKRIKPHASELIALSDFIQREFEKNHGIKPQTIIPVGIDASDFPSENIARDIDILGAGALIPLKQYDIFVEVIKGLTQELPLIKAMICGKGPEEKKLKQLIEKTGLHQNCELTGELSHPQLLRQMKRSRVFLHTSNYEGFGTVCLEALYAGTPVISFCKPMNAAIPHWYIVQTKEEMISKAIAILKDTSAEYDPVLPFPIQGSLEKMMQLFSK